MIVNIPQTILNEGKCKTLSSQINKIKTFMIKHEVVNLDKWDGQMSDSYIRPSSDVLILIVEIYNI